MAEKIRKYGPVAIELALAAGFWFVCKPLTGIFVILAVGGFVRDVALGDTFAWSRKGAFTVGLLYGAIMALIVAYGAYLWGNGLFENLGLGLWGLIAVGYVSFGYQPYTRIHENRHVIATGGEVAYIALALTLFLVPSLR